MSASWLYFRALTICFIICGVLATIVIAIHDWGKPISKCDLAQARFQIDAGALGQSKQSIDLKLISGNLSKIGTLQYCFTHKKSRAESGKVGQVIWGPLEGHFQRKHGCDMLRYEQKFMKHYINSPFLSTDRHSHAPTKKDKHRDRK